MIERLTTGEANPKIIHAERGESVGHAQRRAEKMAVLTSTDVTIIHNNYPYHVYHEQAKERFTPDEIRATLKKLRKDKKWIKQDAKKKVAQISAEIEEEMNFAREIFPEEFPQEPTSKLSSVPISN